MTPAVVIDNDTDFHPPSYPEPSKARTLLLAPPSIASHEAKLRDVLTSYDRLVTDLQMLDRLSAGLVTLPEVTYDLVVILSDANGTRNESSQLLGRDVFGRIVRALKAGGKLQAKDGSSHPVLEHDQLREAILAGLVAEGDFLVRPDNSASDALPLKLSWRKDKKAAVSSAGPPVETLTNPGLGKRKGGDISQNNANGVGFVDFSSDFDDPIITGEDNDDDELIDEDTLLTEEDLKRPLNIPPECAPRAGKRRRACKDCTCGLAQKIAAEDQATRANAEAQLRTLKLDADDLAEVDFTVKGKVGSCGNCSLGDAFRCDGCPYIGMPAFKPGEEVRLLNNDVQL